MSFLDGFLKVTDNRTGQEFLIFSWEKELLDDGFLVEPCSSSDFFFLNRSKHYFVPSRLLDFEGFIKE